MKTKAQWDREYRAYRKTHQWNSLCLARQMRDGFCCAACSRKTGLQAHHRRYPLTWDLDHVGNLLTLCSRCHKAITRALGHGTKRRAR